MHNKNSQTNQGIMPDSNVHIARLESKLKKLRKQDLNKVTGKDLINSMGQFKEIYMRDYFKSNCLSDVNEQNAVILETVNTSYLERRIIPEQPVNTEETQSLVENDWLLKENSQNQELSQTNSVDEQKIE